MSSNERIQELEEKIRELNEKVLSQELEDNTLRRDRESRRARNYKNTWWILLLLLFISVAFLAINLILQSLIDFEEVFKEILGIDFGTIDRRHDFETWNQTVFRTATLFLAFLITFTGAVYMLRAVEVIYKLFTEKNRFKGSVSIGSPGLIMVMIGVMLAGYVITYDPQPPINPDTSFTRNSDSIDKADRTTYTKDE